MKGRTGSTLSRTKYGMPNASALRQAVIDWYCTVPGADSTANDPETANDPQNGPQMILDRKWSLKSTANDPVKTWGMEWILWDWLQKRTDYKKETFFSRLLKKKGRRTLHLRSIYTRWKKKNGINLKRIWYSPYTSFFVRIQFYVINSKTFVRNLGARYVTRHDLT